MKTLRNRKTITVGIIAVLLIFVTGIFAFSGMATMAYAQGDESIRDGYTMEDVQELLDESNSLSSVGTRYLTIYNQDGTMENIEVDEEEEESSPQSLIQPLAAPSFTTHTLINSNRADSQSIVVMIMGDGFTSGQQATFVAAAQETADHLVEQYPMSLFKDYFNIYAIEVISSESGVSNDINDFNWWTNNPSNVNNYFGSRFYFDANMFNPKGTPRLLYISKESKVKELERTNTVMSIILCNSTTYGGGGGKYAVSSLSRDSFGNLHTPETSAHEFGHAFGGLKDEYWWASGASEAPNMTKTSSTSAVKWSQWIDSSSTGIYRIDVNQHGFAGASASWYKPSTSCKMQALGNNFCAVCSAEFIRLMGTKVGIIFSTTNLSGNNIKLESMNLNYQGHFAIPNKINGRFVTEIGISAFF